MLFILLTLVLIIPALLYLWLQHHYSYWTRCNVPHEKPFLLFGNIRGIGRDVHWKHIDQRIYKKFKPTGAPFVGFYTFLTRDIFLLDLDLIKQIMITDFTSFPNRGLFNNVRDDPLTGNLLFLDGELWRVLRRKLTPVFTTGRMRYMFSTMVAVGNRLTDACEELLLHSPSSGAVDIEAKELCSIYTTNIICSCALGIECNSFNDPDSEFRRMGKALTDRHRYPLLVQCLIFAHVDLARKLRIKYFPDDVTAFFMKIIGETVAYREKHCIHRNDFMDLLIGLKQKNDQVTADIDGEYDLSNGLTMDHLAAQVMLFFMAGYETSATTMSFCMYELALNPDIQQTLREEVQRVLTKYGGEVTYEAVGEMNYLKQVVAETLRKRTILPHIVRQSVVDYRVPHTDFVIKRGTDVIIPVDAIHNDPLLYPEPEKFDPERFSPEQCAQRHPSAYMPFGDGPRNCIALRFGELQVKIGIIMLLQRYRLSATTKTQIPLRICKNKFLVGAESGIYLKLERL